VLLTEVVANLAEIIDMEAVIFPVRQPLGDVKSTCAHTGLLQVMTAGYVPHTPLYEGLEEFVKWYVGHHLKYGEKG
jgi:hypothetical protein